MELEGLLESPLILRYIALIYTAWNVMHYHSAGSSQQSLAQQDSTVTSQHLLSDLQNWFKLIMVRLAHSLYSQRHLRRGTLRVTRRAPHSACLAARHSPGTHRVALQMYHYASVGKNILLYCLCWDVWAEQHWYVKI